MALKAFSRVLGTHGIDITGVILTMNLLFDSHYKVSKSFILLHSNWLNLINLTMSFRSNLLYGRRN